MSEIKFCLQLNIYHVEISNFMNRGEFLDFNSITVADRTCLPCGKPQCFINVQNIEIYIYSDTSASKDNLFQNHIC
jgi:hypothetical protein